MEGGWHGLKGIWKGWEDQRWFRGLQEIWGVGKGGLEFMKDLEGVEEVEGILSGV